MKITVFGPNGMLGQAMLKAIVAAGHEPNPIPARIEKSITGHVRNSVVINCAGRVPQKSGSDLDMVQTNGLGPHILAEVCDRAMVRLVHVSTDCVFSDVGPHDELDLISPISLYGTSKATGEIIYRPHLTVRVSFVGESTHGLVHDLRTNRIVDASLGLLWSGHTVGTVAEYLVMLAMNSDITGLLHMPGEWRSRYELATKLARYLKLNTIINQQVSFRADRRLISSYWFARGLPTPPDFDYQLEHGGLE